MLVRVVRDGAYAHETLDAELKKSELKTQERASATAITYEAIALLPALEALLKRYAKKPQGLKPGVRAALMLGFYELFYRGTPAHAAVNQTVEAVKGIHSYSARTANAIMRAAAREVSDFPHLEGANEEEARLLETGCPSALYDRLLLTWPDETVRAWARTSRKPAPLYAYEMLGAQNQTADNCVSGTPSYPHAVRPYPEWPQTLNLLNPAQAIRSQLVKSRSLQVMDAAAQMTGYACRVHPGMSVLEIGAGRGSKTFMLADCARREGAPLKHLIAVDLYENKLQGVKERSKALGWGEIDTVAVNAADDDALTQAVRNELFDVVLVDAPCSGLGTLRRHPDKLYRLDPDAIDQLALLDGELLETAAKRVKPGGTLVYATCTMTREENVEVVENFLASMLGQEFETSVFTSKELPQNWQLSRTEQGWFQSIPRTDECDGHFIARLQRAAAHS